MSERITVDQARGLLDGTTPGPWKSYDPGDGTSRLYGDMDTCHHPEFDEDSRGVHLIQAVNGNWESAASVYLKREDGTLAAAAPDLAKTIVWLYGMRPDTHHPDEGSWWDTEGFLVSIGRRGVALYDNEATTTFLKPDDAVDLARALLAAAGELAVEEQLSRNGHVVDRVRGIIEAGRDDDVDVNLEEDQ